MKRLYAFIGTMLCLCICIVMTILLGYPWIGYANIDYRVPVAIFSLYFMHELFRKKRTRGEIYEAIRDSD